MISRPFPSKSSGAENRTTPRPKTKHTQSIPVPWRALYQGLVCCGGSISKLGFQALLVGKSTFKANALQTATQSCNPKQPCAVLTQSCQTLYPYGCNPLFLYHDAWWFCCSLLLNQKEHKNVALVRGVACLRAFPCVAR